MAKSNRHPGTWHTYDSHQGFTSTAYRLFQDRDGFLWIVAHPPGGICRYDGVDFIYYTLQDGLPGQELAFVHQNRQGRLWVGAQDIHISSGLAWYEEGRFHTDQTDGLPDRLNCMVEDAEGTMWLGGSNYRIYARRDDEITCYDHTQGVPRTNKTCAFCDSRNRVWFGMDNGLVYIEQGRIKLFLTEDGSIAHGVNAICEDAEGTIWIGGQGGLSTFDGVTFINHYEQYNLPQPHIETLLIDGNGHLWIGGSNGGVSCLSDDTVVTFTREDGLHDDIVHHIIEDREGHLWFAHSSGGLSRFEPDSIEPVFDEPVPFYGFATDKDDRIWFSGYDYIGCLAGDTVRQRAVDFPVQDICADSSGGIWCTDQSAGVYSFRDYEAVFSDEPEMRAAVEPDRRFYPICLTEKKSGGMLVGAENGLFHLTDHAFEEIPVGHRNIFMICEDRTGILWMALWRAAGLVRFDGKETRVYTTEHGLPADYVRWIMEDRQGRLWIATIGGGVCHIPASDVADRAENPRFIPLPFNEEFRNIWISRITEDRQGRLWFSTLTNGVYCYDGRNMQVVGTQDGLPSSNITGVAQQPDGAMIIATNSGVIRYRPRMDHPPCILIRQVVADRAYRPHESVEITTATDRITIHFRGLSFRTRRIRYTYRLEGYDDDWRFTADEEVVYTHLPSGEYHFKVVAVDRDLACSETPAAVRISVRTDPRDEHIAVLESEVEHLRQAVGRKYEFDQIIGVSAAVQQMFRLMEKAIDSGLTVLIAGETGTGKELVAKAIHYHSDRRNKPLQEINCGAMPKELIAATLFGYRKGAFTGATEDTPGLFEAADGGTILLDEIGEMSMEAQVHLLRVLQEQTIQRLGETKLRPVDVRVVTATNRDMDKDVQSGVFREDLYYRLSVFPIRLPPLRERDGDIPVLVDHFVRQAEKQFNKSIDGVTPNVRDMLEVYPWPGNVRELENEIFRAAVLVENGQAIEPLHFSPRITQGESWTQVSAGTRETYTEAINRFRKQYITAILRECDGNRTEAARILGIHRPNLVALLRKFDID